MLDSGGQVSCLNWGTVKRLGLEEEIKEQEIGYEGYGQLTATMMGTLTTEVSYQGRVIVVEFMVSTRERTCWVTESA